MYTPSTSTTSTLQTPLTPTTTITTSSSMTGTGTTTSDTFAFPKTHASFPPFFTLQPTSQTRAAQLRKWSDLIQAYCRHHRIYQLNVTDAAASPLFYNAKLNKRLAERDIKTVLDFMVSGEGEARAEWVNAATKNVAWVWWRTPEEWGNLIASWVDETGQKGSVLTLYELVDGEQTEKQEFHGMDMDVLRKSLGLLAKKGRAQVFGAEGQEGVKFF